MAPLLWYTLILSAPGAPKVWLVMNLLYVKFPLRKATVFTIFIKCIIICKGDTLDQNISTVSGIALAINLYGLPV